LNGFKLIITAVYTSFELFVIRNLNLYKLLSSTDKIEFPILKFQPIGIICLVKI